MPTVKASDYPYVPYPTVETPSGGDALGRAYQRIETTSDMFGGLTARALERFGTSLEGAGTTLAKLAIEQQTEFNDTAAREASTRAQDTANRLLYGDPAKPNDTGYFGLTGKTAMEARPATYDQIAQIYADQRTVLQNPQQQRIYDNSTRAYIEHLQANVLNHARKEFQTYQNEVDKNEVRQKLDNAGKAAARNDQEAFQQSLGEALNRHREALVRQGAGEAEIANGLADVTATAVEHWARARQVDNPQAALTFLENNREQFKNPEKYQTLHSQIKAKADEAEGRALVERTRAGAAPTGAAPSGPIPKQVEDEAARQGVSRRLAMTTAEIESNFGQAADRPGSQYQGVFQLGNNEAASVGGRGVAEGVRFLANTKAALTERLGREPEDWEVYLAHNQGVAGAASLLTNPNLTAGEAVTRAGGRPANISSNFRGDPNAPASTFTERVKADFNRRAARYEGPAAPTAAMPATGTPERNKLSDDYAKALDQGFQGTVEDYWAQQRQPPTILTATPAPGVTVPPAGAPAAGPVPDSPLAAHVARINASNASPEVKEKAIAEVRRQHSDMALGQDEAKYELSKAILRGDESITPEYIDTLVRQGKISPSAGTEAVVHLDKEQRERQAKAEAIERVNAAGSGGPPLDPKNEQDRKILNYHYDVTSSLWPRAEALDRSVAYATQYGLVPDKLKSVIRGGLHSGRADQAKLAADTVSRLRNANPQLVGELGDENDLRLANLIGSYTSAGVPADQAVTLATEGLKVSKTDREARTLDFEAQRGKTVKERADDDDRWIGRQQNSWLPGDPNIPSQMRQEFVEVSKAEFERTGNLEAARRTALDQVNRVWGRSFASGEAIPSTLASITGQGGQYMKFAPEKFYEVPGLSPIQNGAWMREQLLKDVAGSALQDPANPITPERLRLLPDPTRSMSGLPVYQVWLVRPDAAWQHVVDANGKPVLWKPDWNASPERQRRAEAQTQDVERARQLRQEQIERERAVPR